MKIKLLPILALLSVLVIFSCEKNPAKEAEKKAKQENRKADMQEDKAEDKLSSGVDHANKAVEHRTKAALNEAISGVPVPSFDNVVAQEFVKKVGNDISAFVNSENYEEGGKYADMINKDIESMQEKLAKGSITEAEAGEITTYAQNLAAAVGIEL